MEGLSGEEGRVVANPARLWGTQANECQHLEEEAAEAAAQMELAGYAGRFVDGSGHVGVGTDVAEVACPAVGGADHRHRDAQGPTGWAAQDVDIPDAGHELGPGDPGRRFGAHVVSALGCRRGRGTREVVNVDVRSVRRRVGDGCGSVVAGGGSGRGMDVG